MHQQVKAYGGGGWRRSYCGIFVAFCVCTITPKKRVDMRFEFSCVFLSVWESSYRWFSGYLHSGIWRRQGLPHRIARDQSLGECDWALDGRSERGDQNEPSRNTSPHSLRAAPVIRRGSSDMFSSRKSAWKRHGTCYYNFI
ncbi:hypothetical protein CLIM01_03098 [Colletotrichum limetticola]|uniref:Uncharacterized protein n=1 Tax=Colletotrichum limetticola TaxID=1209924 RepID=A0ABQ9Q6Y7_9PEZI|nr:hypothetical protein CLIM01_03098 [Colletotrichum limetticola]